MAKKKWELNNNVDIYPSYNGSQYEVTPTFTQTTVPDQWQKKYAKEDEARRKGAEAVTDTGIAGFPTLGGALANGLNVGAQTAVKTQPRLSGGGGGGSGTPLVTYNPYRAYNSPYQSQIDELMKALMNRDPFNYDYLSDPTYLAYRQQYEFQGDRARENAIGDYARNTGGLASSWATTAGELAQNNYNAQLNSLIPELENARYNKYLGEIEVDTNNLNSLQNLENARYNRYLQERDYDLQLQQLNNARKTRASSGSGSGRSSSKTDTSYQRDMLQDYINSGLDVEEYIKQNLGALTDDDMAYLRKNKGLGGNGSGSLGLNFGGDTASSSGVGSGWLSSLFSGTYDAQEAIRQAVEEENRRKVYGRLYV